MTKPFDPFNQCTEYYYRIEKLLADNTALKAENEILRKDMLATQEQLAIRTQEFDVAWKQLAMAEQRVAEACALLCMDAVTKSKRSLFRSGAMIAADNIRDGEWRKHMKGE